MRSSQRPSGLPSGTRRYGDDSASGGAPTLLPAPGSTRWPCAPAAVRVTGGDAAVLSYVDGVVTRLRGNKQVLRESGVGAEMRSLP